jgi:hypothetical protein
MQTECSADLFGFAPVERRAVVAGFDGGRMTSDAGALLLGATDRAIGLVKRFAECFADSRAAELIEHEVVTLVGQRVFGIALGYEDLVDHDQLRHDPAMAVLAGKLSARRKDCAPLAGKSTLNRLELGGPELTRYHRIAWDGAQIEGLFVDLFVEAHQHPPKQIILDLDATDDPLHGHQEGRFFHGYGACPRAGEAGPGGLLLLSAAVPLLRPASVGVQAAARRHRRGRRGGRGNRAHRDADPRPLAAGAHCAAGRFGVCPRGSDGVVRGQWGGFSVRPGQKPASGRRDRRRTRRRRGGQQGQRPAGAPLHRVLLVDARQLEPPAPRRCQSLPLRKQGAEWTAGEANPRFVVTSLSGEDAEPQRLYEEIYCARGDMENRIKECQLDLFADCTSAATMRANQLRLWFASMAYVLLCALRRIALQKTQFAKATCGTIRLKLLKIGALVRISVRRIKFAMASGCPYQRDFALAHAQLVNAAAAR